MAIGVATRLAMCSGLMSSALKGASISSEHSRICWSLFLLDRMHGSSFQCLPAISTEDVLPEMPSSAGRPATMGQTGSGEPGDPQSSIEKDAGIGSYALRLMSIWGRLMSYLGTAKLGNFEDAWTSNSIYQQIKSEMSRLETVLPEVHRFKNSRFHELTLAQLKSHRNYWARWIFVQVLYHTLHCTLNHPFLHLARIRGLKRSRSPSFLQHATDQAELHSEWVVLLLGLCEKTNFEIFDPFIGHLASMVATALFVLRFSKDESVAAKAFKGFSMLRSFVEKMATVHPHLRHTVSSFSDHITDLEFNYG